MSARLAVARDLAKEYAIGATIVNALEPCSFEIGAGDRIAIVGPSGSGKSTLLHLVAGLEEASGGSLEWPALGDRRSLRPSKISLIFQVQSLVPELTAVENVELPLILAGADSSTARSAARCALALIGLEELEGKLPQELSVGQAQRIAAARAIVHRPALILADEPTGQLDHATGERLMLALLGAVEGSDAALVVATHDLDVAERMRTRWRLEHGRLLVTETVS
jgi:ABC-type lipoprotein export system ATPase subunit